MAKLAKVVGLLSLIAIAIGLLVVVPRPKVIFSSSPEVEAHWQVANPDGNVIGSEIFATLTVVSPYGVEIDQTSLPYVGSEFGELEVHSISQRQDYSYNRVLTEVRYTFQYLSPIDFDRKVTQRTTPDLYLFYSYFARQDGEVEEQTVEVAVPGFSYSLLRRVGPQSTPRPLAPKWPQPIPYGLVLEFFGMVLLAFAPIYWGVSWLRNRKKEKFSLPAGAFEPALTVSDYYQLWEFTQDHSYFEKAVLAYCKPFWFVQDSERPKFWEKAMEILYGKSTLSRAEIKEIFIKMMEEGNV